MKIRGLLFTYEGPKLALSIDCMGLRTVLRYGAACDLVHVCDWRLTLAQGDIATDLNKCRRHVLMAATSDMNVIDFL